MLVIACNTAASACLHDARERYSVPVVEVIRPAVRRAVAATRNGRVGVVGTTSTIASGAYEDAFAAAPQVQVSSVACPQFVDFVERGVTSGRALLGLASAYLEPLQRAEVDTLVLGCTHYPLLAGLISVVMGDGVTLVSSADETAKDVYRALTGGACSLAASRPGPGAFGSQEEPAWPVRHQFLTTSDAEQFARLARRFLGADILAGAPVEVLPVPARSGMAG
jgi:glutamate racemase